MIHRTTAAAARLAFALGLIAFRAEPAGAQAIGYSLSPGSEFRTGCFEPPCACGPVQNPMTGTFALIRRPSTPPFANYDVVGVHWVVQFLVGVVTITGAGSYRVGGSGVVQQQLSLDLVVGGGPVRHFDSGLVAGGSDFPRIEADISLYGGIGCGDTTLIVRAGAGGSTLDAGAPGLALAPLAPNPFRGATRLEFALREDGPVRVTVHDPAGRCVRTLGDGDWLAAGVHAVAWDGRGEDGRTVPPGLYFVLVQAPGASRRTSVIKLR
jgi:hypothetical protein